MQALVFLAIALVIVLVVAAWLYYRDRRPLSLDESIDSFQRELDALAPDAGRPRGYAERGIGRGPTGGGRSG